MHDKCMNHSGTANAHHDFTGSKAAILNKNINKRMDFVKGKGNPYMIKAPLVKLQNDLTKQIIDQEVAERLLNLKETGEALIKEFRKERFIEQKGS